MPPNIGFPTEDEYSKNIVIDGAWEYCDDSLVNPVCEPKTLNYNNCGYTCDGIVKYSNLDDTFFTNILYTLTR